MENFQELGLPEFLGHSLKQMNFVKPTPVQAQAIPAGLLGKDVIASAQTGTGKTAAFGIPLLVFLEKNKDKTALVMTPTRELAMQVLDVLHKLSGHHPLGGSVLLIGGANMGGQLNLLSRKPRLIIGTPGRIIDHLNRGSLSLGKTGFLVLDEADRMLDMGFAPQLEQIRSKLLGERQTLLFSATLPSDIQAMAAKYLKDPVRITVGSTAQPVPKIVQKVLYTTEPKKPEELVSELKERQGSILIFARTQHRVDRILTRLKEQGFKASRIHGGRTQSQRKQAIDQFREGKFLILVATDIAARGLDIHHIAHVINYDLPRNPEDYIHRVGRTARAGAEGESLCFLTPEDRDLWRRILRLMGVSEGSITVKPSRFGFSAPKEPLSPAPHRHPGPRPHTSSPPQHRQDHSPRQPGHRNDRPFRPKLEHFRREEHRHGERPQGGQGHHPQRHDQRPGGFDPRREHHLKHRHPGGRHQQRSEDHAKRQHFGGDGRREDRSHFQNREGNPPSSSPNYEEKQPTDNRSAWEKTPYQGKHQNRFSTDRRPGGGHSQHQGFGGQHRPQRNFQPGSGFKKRGRPNQGHHRSF